MTTVGSNNLDFTIAGEDGQKAESVVSNGETNCTVTPPYQQADTRVIGDQTADDVTIRGLLVKYMPKRSLSADGELYLKRVNELCQAKNIECSRLTTMNGVILHTTKVELHAKIGIVCVFVEQFPIDPDYAPMTKYNDRVVQDACALIPDLSVLDIHYVLAADYGRPEMLYDAVYNCFETFATPVTLDAFKGNEYRWNNNLEHVRSILRAVSPNGVPGYIQYGVSLEFNMTDATKGFNNYGRARDDQNWVSVAAVGGYTDYVKNDYYNEQEKLFVPAVHLSECTAVIKQPGFVAIILAMAAQNFIGNKMWQSPYGLSQQQNIGSLVIDPETQRPCEVKSKTEQDRFFSKYIGEPNLIVDVTEGKLSVPGLNFLKDADGNALLIDYISAFVNSARFKQEVSCISAKSITQYTGHVVAGGDLVDSRSLDYFRLLEDNFGKGVVDTRIEKFLEYSGNPASRLKGLAELGYDNIQSIYTTTSCILDPIAIGVITNHVARTFKPISDINRQNTYDTSDFANIGRALTDVLNKSEHFQSSGAGSRYNTYTGNSATYDAYRRTFRR